ncbi:MAG: hypothetical protein GY754_23905 [bacterium]|nr:hypothetical protein [bacterium]
MAEYSYEEIIENNYPVCERCDEILKQGNGTIPIEGLEIVDGIRPKMWRHSARDVYHAWVRIEGRHIFLCATKEFDETILKRIQPLHLDNAEEAYTWNVSINGNIFLIVEHGKEQYEILNEDGTIVMDEVVEAKVFNHMIAAR